MTAVRLEQLLNRMRLRQVALLLAIDETGTMHAAAQRLGMTQSAASKMLSELEETLGEPLYDRVGRGLVVNPAGRATLNTFRSLRNSMVALGQELNELRHGGSGKLLIGSITAAAPVYLSTAIIRLKESYPRVAIELHIDTSDCLIELLRDNRLDIVIGRMPNPTSTVNQDCFFTPISEEALSVVAACDHPLARMPRKKPFPFEALLDYPWILQLKGSPLREVIEQEFLSHHAALPPGMVETSSFLTATDLVAHSQMIAVVPHAMAKRFDNHNMLRILPYTFIHSLSSWGSLVHRDHYVSPVMEKFLELMRGGI